jgi:hypothetical protein
MKVLKKRNTCALTFIAVLLTTAQIKNQPQMDKDTYIYTHTYIYIYMYTNTNI